MNKTFLMGAFQLEEERAKLASQKKYKKLKSTYNSRRKIPNFNSPKIWNKKNAANAIDRRNNPMAYHRYRLVSRLITRGNCKNVLNFACGSGELEKHVFKKNRKLSWYGVDFADRSVAVLKQKYPFANFKVGCLERTGYPKDYFDCVVALEVLEHVSPNKTFRVFAEINRVLTSAGILIISVPLNEGLKEMVLRGENPNCHVRTYTPKLVEAELKIAGFKVLKKYLLYAFHDFYWLKTFIVRYFLPNFRSPNKIILIAKKNCAKI